MKRFLHLGDTFKNKADPCLPYMHIKMPIKTPFNIVNVSYGHPELPVPCNKHNSKWVEATQSLIGKQKS